MGADLTTRARAAGLRVLLVRRPGRAVAGRLRRWAIVESSPRHEGTRWGTFTDDHELLSLPLVGDARNRDAPGATSTDAIYLVCTHGRHDPCCAMRGRPLAAALAQARPEATWECSHIGGDRFAANLLVLPHGLYYGHVTPRSAQEIVAAHEAGRIFPEALRGRSSFPAPVQAAQHHARAELGETLLDTLHPLSMERIHAGTWKVSLHRKGGPVTVTIREDPTSDAALLTCAATRAVRPQAFRLVALEPHKRTR